MPVNLAQPTGAVTNIITGTGIGDTGTTYLIYTFKAFFSYTTEIANVSGDGDAAPHFIDNGWRIIRFRLMGGVTEAAAIGIASLGGGSINAMTYALSGGRTLLIDKPILQAINISHDRDAPFVGLELIGYGTEQTSGEEP